MALTKKDLENIQLAVATVVDIRFEQYVTPLHVWAKDVNNILTVLNERVVRLDQGVASLDQRVASLDERVISLSDRMDKHVFGTEKKVSDHEYLLGSYVGDFVSTKKFNHLEKRVEKLEIARV